jgi:transposase
MSPSRKIKQLDAQINSALRGFDFSKFSVKERDILANLRQNLTNARIYTTDYELSETREEQLENTKKAKKWLEQARKNILIASESNIFGAIDIAHLTAQMDQIISELK